ncbi:MAG: AAA family ATPase, partial [Synergistaceae bacterium]|nr:AAA family ATPase [Synergistaceae bacterium]
MSLFTVPDNEPLAARMRPETLEDFVGQQHLIAPGKILRRIIDSDRIPSMIFWGPPGVGKTTLAGIIAQKTKAEFITFSAVTGGIKEIREVMKQSDANRNFGTRTILFVDEIHRFNKAQQDAFLPFVERGSIILIGATTENPSFEINGALLSRCKVFVLKALSVDDIVGLLRRGLSVLNVTADDDILRAIANFS